MEPVLRSPLHHIGQDIGGPNLHDALGTHLAQDGILSFDPL
jgi:hypothetical protein